MQNQTRRIKISIFAIFCIIILLFALVLLSRENTENVPSNVPGMVLVAEAQDFKSDLRLYKVEDHGNLCYLSNQGGVWCVQEFLQAP